ncbi:hypothetical protein CDD83_6129 [Cordyceps sp. RAO-2017]|nr:hypothetical protein CDD83_6129 [Cordyceps sp. RAO-2017]
MKNSLLVAAAVAASARIVGAAPMALPNNVPFVCNPVPGEGGGAAGAVSAQGGPRMTSGSGAVRSSADGVSAYRAGDERMSSQGGSGRFSADVVVSSQQGGAAGSAVNRDGGPTRGEGDGRRGQR